MTLYFSMVNKIINKYLFKIAKVLFQIIIITNNLLSIIHYRNQIIQVIKFRFMTYIFIKK